jgi:hypothetical protein
MSERRMWPTPTALDATSRAHRTFARGNWKTCSLEAQVITMDVEPVSSQLTLFAEAFPASRTPWLADVPAPQTSATSGPSLSDSFASVDPDGSWRKTWQGYSQVTLDGSLARFSETWPRAGMTRSGRAYRLQPLVRPTDETECGSSLIPTATTQDHFSARVTANRKKEWVSHPGTTLLDYARLWPTPNAGGEKWGGTLQEWGGSQSWVRDYPDLASGQLNPTWVEWLMGYPLGWTACAAWGTASSRRSRSGSRGGSSTRKPPGAAAG